MVKCFIDVGLAPQPEFTTAEHADYKVYTDHKRGSLNPNLWAARQFIVPDFSLGDVIDGQEMATRHDELDNLSADDDSDDCDDVEE